MKRLDPTYISKQLAVRDVILDKGYAEKENGNKNRYALYYKQADSIQKRITSDLINNFDAYSVDEVLETLTRFGDAPCLMNDDNGKWAVSGDGYQPVVIDDEVINGSINVVVEGHMWKKTIREALFHYMTYEEPEAEEREDTKWIDDLLRENAIDPKGSA